MNILIASDSHGNTDGVRYLIKKVAPLNDLLLFLGDGIGDWFEHGRCISPIPFYCVRGNCDLMGYPPASLDGYGEVRGEEILTLGKYRVLITHGHKYGVKNGLESIIAYAASMNIDIVLYGHTHIAHEERISEGESVLFTQLKKPIYIFNPGSLKKGYFVDSTFGTMTLSDSGVVFGHGYATAAPHN